MPFVQMAFVCDRSFVSLNYISVKISLPHFFLMTHVGGGYKKCPFRIYELILTQSKISGLCINTSAKPIRISSYYITMICILSDGSQFVGPFHWFFEFHEENHHEGQVLDVRTPFPKIRVPEILKIEKAPLN